MHSINTVKVHIERRVFERLAFYQHRKSTYRTTGIERLAFYQHRKSTYR